MEYDIVSACNNSAVSLRSFTRLLGRECIVEMESESVRVVSVGEVAQIVAQVAQHS